MSVFENDLRCTAIEKCDGFQKDGTPCILTLDF